MAEASISVDQEQLSCPVCLDLLNDPVTIPCGHSFCLVCITHCWDQDDQRGIYSCPQCRETFTPRPVLRKNYFMAEMLGKVKKPELPTASPAHGYAGPGDVECDFCTGRKFKAIKSCLVCVASLCDTHLKPHLEIPALIKHKLVKVSTRLQEKICSQHGEVVKIYCRTDQSCICYMCSMHEHKGHDTVEAAVERTKKQSELKEVQRKSLQRLQDKEKKLQELKQTVDILKSSAQTAVKDSERIFTDLIHSIEKKRSEVIKLIRSQEKKQLNQAEELLENLQQEIADLKRRSTELEQLSHTKDHIQFLQSFQSLSTSSRCEDYITVQHLSFDGVRKSLSDLKERLEQFCKEEFSKISPHAAPIQKSLSSEPKKRDFLQSAAVQKILTSEPKSRDDDLPCVRASAAAAVQKVLSSEPKTREDFLQYFCQLTLDPNTVNHELGLSERNRVVKYRGGEQRYSDHPERFDYWTQVLCKESVNGRCYWEVEWSKGGWVGISVSYKRVMRKGKGDECVFGLNNQSWSLLCSKTPSFWHNNTQTKISGPSSSRIGVYVDHSAGTLSFYSVSDTMTLLHTVHTTFTQPLYPGFRVVGTVRLSDPN